MNPDPDPIIE